MGECGEVCEPGENSKDRRKFLLIIVRLGKPFGSLS